MRAEAGASCRLRSVALALGLAGCAAPTLAARPRATFPFWSVAEAAPQKVGCASVVTWVSRSGKEGLGASVQVSAPDGPCAFELAGARVELPTEAVEGATLPPPRTLGPGEVARAYVPFAFDNEASWNRSESRATLHLRVVAGAERRELRIPLLHRPYSFLREPVPLAKGAPTIEKLELKQLYPPPPPKPATPAPAPAPAPAGGP